MPLPNYEFMGLTKTIREIEEEGEDYSLFASHDALTAYPH